MITPIAVIHELREVQVRCKRKETAIDGIPTIPLGIGDVLLLVTACVRRADIHERTESCLALFILFDVLKRTVRGGIVVALVIELADSHKLSHLSREVRPHTNVRA